MPLEKYNNTLLIIDDEATVINLISDFLNEQGIEIMVAKNGLDGISRAKNGQPDLILLDIRMPEMDGYEVCHQLKLDETTRDIPIIFMTGLTELDDKLKAFAVGGVDYVTKPFQRSELLARVSVHLQISNLQKELADKNVRLEGALDTGNVVNVAIGVLMEQKGIGRDEAFEIIRSQARAQRVKVSVIANEILAGH
ncbi:MAG: response regulator [Gammaproteobacteria bacterium]|nr:response regulator [Gammaproteobacteria bacterium]